MPLSVIQDPDTRGIPSEASDEERMRALINILSAYIEYYHGGALEFVAFDGHTLQVRMLGNCAGCNLSQMTLGGWIKGTAKEFFPDLEGVEAV